MPLAHIAPMASSNPFDTKKLLANRNTMESSFRFVPPANTLSTPSENPENACYCNETRECLNTVSGLFDVSGCNLNAPLLMSWPHFFQV